MASDIRIPGAGGAGASADGVLSGTTQAVAQRPSENQPAVLIAEWPRNSRETIRLRLDFYNGRHVVDLRTWWADARGELKPGRTGLTVSVRHLPQLSAAFVAALGRAVELGLVEPEDGSP